MNSNPVKTAGAISGRAIGVLFFAGFGSLWLGTGLAAAHRFNIMSGAALVIILALLVIPAARLLGRVAKAPKAEIDAELERHIKHTFTVVNTIQWLAIAAVVIVLNVFHFGEYIVPGIAIIVGLHLFPLARVFRYSAHYVTGTLLVLWSVGVAVILQKQDVPSIGALGTAAILLLSATYTLIVATRAARYLLESPA